MPSKVAEVLFEAKGICFNGRKTPADILAELQRQKDCARDYVVNTRKVNFTVDTSHRLVACIEGTAEHPLHLCLPLNRRAHSQVAEFIGIPMKSRLYGRFTDGTKEDSAVYYPTWARVYNDVFTLEPSRRLFRVMETIDGQAFLRAFLSDHYKPIDNIDVFLAAADALEAVGAEILHVRLDDDRFCLYAVAKGIAAQIDSTRTFTDASGKQVRWTGSDNDVVNAAIRISNSETGEGMCVIQPAIFRSISESYVPFESNLSKRHVGGLDEGDEVMISAETRRKKNDAFFSEIKDWTTNTFKPEMLERYVKLMQNATMDEVDDPTATVEALRITYDISEERKQSIFDRFLKSGDRSRYGLAQAVLDESTGKDMSPAEGMMLEQVGSRVLTEVTSAVLAETGRRAISTVAKPKVRKQRYSVREAASLVASAM